MRPHEPGITVPRYPRHVTPVVALSLGLPPRAPVVADVISPESSRPLPACPRKQRPCRHTLCTTLDAPPGFPCSTFGPVALSPRSPAPPQRRYWDTGAPACTCRSDNRTQQQAGTMHVIRPWPHEPTSAPTRQLAPSRRAQSAVSPTPHQVRYQRRGHSSSACRRRTRAGAKSHLQAAWASRPCR